MSTAFSKEKGLPAAAVRARVPVHLERGVPVCADLVSFDGLIDGREHLAVVFPGPTAPRSVPPLVRVHSECLTGDSLGCCRCRCGPQLDEAIGLLSERGGVLLYLRQEGRGIGLYLKLDAYLLQDANVDTYRANRLLGRGADERDYRVAAQMLFALGISAVELLTNNVDKVEQLGAQGIEIVDVVRSVAALSCGSDDRAAAG
ncbi:GTP cyclohydrolase II RibA [Nocardia grenadensis]|uniref:GTP cyclohydrolase II RibA n=1 Tax=Nocardia grenadensis TaxID=931537 RepID=UPI003D75D62F